MRAASLALAATIGALLVALPARADAPATAIGASFLASPDESYGASLIGDLWFPVGPLRFGGTFGIAAMPSGGDEFNRIFMPLAASVAFEIVGDVGVSVRARGGFWGGATQEEKLTGGALVGFGAHFLAAIGGGANVTIGLDVWGLLGAGATVVFAPTAGLSWTPPPSDLRAPAGDSLEGEDAGEPPPLGDPEPWRQDDPETGAGAEPAPERGGDPSASEAELEPGADREPREPSPPAAPAGDP